MGADRGPRQPFDPLQPRPIRAVEVAALLPRSDRRKSRVKPIKHDRRRYKRCNRIEIVFGLLKDGRRIATRYDWCAKTFLAAVALATTVML